MLLQANFHALDLYTNFSLCAFYQNIKKKTQVVRCFFVMLVQLPSFVVTNCQNNSGDILKMLIVLESRLNLMATLILELL